MRCDRCPVAADRECVIEDAFAGLCDREEYRRLAWRESIKAELLPIVAACPHRGFVLPVSRQPECGACAELTECKAGKGPHPRRDAVTLEECLICVSGATGRPAPPPGRPGTAG